MARFRGTIWGSAGSAARLGTEASGTNVACNGWAVGVDVVANVDSDGNDVFTITQTQGSADSRSSRELGRIRNGVFSLTPQP